MIVVRTPAVNTRDRIGTSNPDPPDVWSWEDTSPENKIEGNWVFTTNSDVLIPISLQPNVLEHLQAMDFVMSKKFKISQVGNI